MRVLTAAEVLSAWERTRGQPALRQALEYLACAAPERSFDEWCSRTVGQVCLALFHLREALFGPDLPGIATCPHCAERLEFVFSCEGLATEGAATSPGQLTIAFGDRSIVIRPPTVADLLESRSATELLERCAGERIDVDAKWIELASARVAEADSFAETMLDLACPSCGHQWQAVLDIAAYLAREVAHRARRLLAEVHRLASAYGWSESEILGLSQARRNAYLEMAGT